MVSYRTVTFVAAGPFCPSSISNETRSPSFREGSSETWYNVNWPEAYHLRKEHDVTQKVETILIQLVKLPVACD